MLDSRERVTNISRSYSGKKEERKATMVSKLEYVGEHSMMIFTKEQTEHSGYRNAEFFFTYFFSLYYFIFITLLKISILYGDILTFFIKSLEVLNHIKSISFLYSVRTPT